MIAAREEMPEDLRGAVDCVQRMLQAPRALPLIADEASALVARYFAGVPRPILGSLRPAVEPDSTGGFNAVLFSG